MLNSAPDYSRTISRWLSVLKAKLPGVRNSRLPSRTIKKKDLGWGTLLWSRYHIVLPWWWSDWLNWVFFISIRNKGKRVVMGRHRGIQSVNWVEKNDNFVHNSRGFVLYTFEKLEGDFDHTGYSAFELEGKVVKALYHFKDKFLVKLLCVLLEFVQNLGLVRSSG